MDGALQWQSYQHWFLAGITILTNLRYYEIRYISAGYDTIPPLSLLHKNLVAAALPPICENTRSDDQPIKFARRNNLLLYRFVGIWVFEHHSKRQTLKDVDGRFAVASTKARDTDQTSHV